MKRLLSSAIIIFVLLFLSLSSCATSAVTDIQDGGKSESLSAECAATGEDERLPLDPAVMTGMLDNGLTWFIRENSKPEGRAFLKLVVKAGSVLEDDDQQGIAHLVEHMAFNGTENFEKMELVNYLESIGMAFGPEVNAYTSFDETLYMLEIPTDDEEIIDKAFLILEDWAHRLTMDGEEIEKERSVVREEWRLGRGASGRIRDQILPVLLGESRYAERLPIGKMDVVMNTPADRIRDFYKEWYRPELMGLIVVGDIDGEKIRDLIENRFSLIPPGEGRPRIEYKIPVNQMPATGVFSDPEVQTASFDLSIKTDTPPMSTMDDYRSYLVSSIFWGILNTRLNEIGRSADPPFIRAAAGLSRFTPERSFITCTATVSSEKVEQGLESVVKEIIRIMEYGVLEEELAREKAEHMTFIESAWQDRENIKSDSLAGELVAYYLKDVFMPGIDVEYGLFNEFLPSITKDDIDRYGASMFPEEGRSLTVTLPESDAGGIAEGDELMAMVEELKDWIPEPPEQEMLPEELMERPEKSGRIVSREVSEETGTVTWVLNEGQRIIYKKTDFMEDEILFQAYSPGGLSLVPDDEYHMGTYAPLFLSVSGLGPYSAGDLEKILSGKDVSVKPYIDDYFEGFQGQASPGDLETLFQLIHLHFNNPGYKKEYFENVKTRLVPLVENRLKDPQNLYTDRLRELISSGAYRSKPLDSEILDEMRIDVVEKIWNDRFSSPGDFTYIFVGNIDPDLLEELALSYLHIYGDEVKGFESDGKQVSEQWQDLGIRPVEGVVDKEVLKGLEPKGRVTFYFHGEGSMTEQEQEVLPVLGEMLQTTFREVVREDMSGTYSIYVGAAPVIYPYDGWTVYISFGCDPERTDELSGKVLGMIEDVKTRGIDEEYSRNEIEKYRRSLEVNVKENSFWLSHILESVRDRNELEMPLTPEEFEENLRSVSLEELASRVFGDDYIRLVLLPSEDVF